MLPMQGKVKVSVSYDSRGNRLNKVFEDAYAARRFYASKLKQGKNPRVHKFVEENNENPEN